MQQVREWGAEDFRAWCDEMEWSPAQAAVALNVAKGTVTDWLTGRTKVNVHVVSLCHVISVALKTPDAGEYTDDAHLNTLFAFARQRIVEADKVATSGSGRKPPVPTFRVTPYKAMAGFYVRLIFPDGHAVHIDDNRQPNVPAFATEADAQRWIDERGPAWLKAYQRALRDAASK